jgi:hypothetical protein
VHPSTSESAVDATTVRTVLEDQDVDSRSDHHDSIAVCRLTYVAMVAIACWSVALLLLVWLLLARTAVAVVRPVLASALAAAADVAEGCMLVSAEPCVSLLTIHM